ncbi:MAG: riboflavin synthase [Candidatus Zixiibacteriota bacterium]
MFTGIIETIGLVEALRPQGNYAILTVKSSLPSEEIQIGESIACHGVCLTVVARDVGSLTAELSQETAARVDMSRLKAGSRINLERALQMGSRLGGHLVTGHVDTTGPVDYLKPVGRSLELAVKFEPGFDALVINKGSIAIDGVSLTVNHCRSGWLSVNLIPHTGQATTLSDLKPGEAVNLEFDLIGKYILKYQQSGSSRGITEEMLRGSGW